MTVLTLLLALLAWLLGPFAPLVPFALIGLFAVVPASTTGERSPSSEASSIAASPIDAPATEPNQPLCFGTPATIVGRGHTIEGTDGDDVIVGRGRRNMIHAGAGDDLVCGGGGSDQLSGGEGHDRLGGGPGNDWLYDREGEQDDLYGGPGRDRCEALSRSAVNCEHHVVFDCPVNQPWRTADQELRSTE